MAAQDYKLFENVFIETNLQSSDYDAVILIVYPDELKVDLPRHVRSYVNDITKLDKHVQKVATVWNCEYVSGGRLVLSPTGKITPYHDVVVLKEAAKKGVLRALDAGAKCPLLVVQNVVDFPDGQLVAILGALEALYVPLQLREREGTKNCTKIGFHAEEKVTKEFEKVVRNAIGLERARILTRDIGGADPERMTPARIVEYVKASFADDIYIKVNVIDNEEVIAKEYPLLAAVSRAANRVDRHKPRVVEIVYIPSDIARVSETLMLVGKGVTYDTGGADIKTAGKMAGMSRDKCGAAAVAGFLKACSILKPSHLKVVGVMCLCRNSVGEDSYVQDELLLSRSGKTVRVTNTDAEGRFAMADSLYKMAEQAGAELNPHIYTIATLTGHAKLCYGDYSAAMDNHSARASNHSNRLQFSGSRIGEGIEVSVVRQEDLAVNIGKCKGDDLLQIDVEAKGRNHQLAAGFLIKVGGLEDKNVKYTHLDIAGGAGMPPQEPTAAPILSLCHAHKNLPYDIDSVLHFSERDYSKNGHRTIMIKKIDIVYGPECRARDRQEKIELCQNYPGVARRKREVTVEVAEDTNLRVNRDITPPPTPSVDERIKDLAIEKEMQDAIEQIYKVSAKALTVARGVYCNQSEPNPKVKDANDVQNKPDILNIIATITEYVKSMVDKAVGNMPEFCKASENIEVYQRNHLGKCPFYGGYPCPKNYRSTKSGAVKYSTHHRPAYYQSTKNKGNPYVPKQFVHWRASGNATANSTDKNAERQGSLDEHTITTVKMDKVKDVADARKHKDIGDHTTVYRTKETGIEIDVIHDRKKRDTDDEGKRVEVRNSDELHEKVKALENDGSVHAKDIPKRTSRWEHRRKFQ
ncbi:unnamed protein product [Chilo suppressalis]|uniref:Cytosol aminopeptidase domain-containing protein n=1 Tax=Chilo suppressalis TaxID=168631 RepID=A0ABN8B6P7_CHISP|nr:unnamed protein product [Chilo suppressalis]